MVRGILRAGGDKGENSVGSLPCGWKGVVLQHQHLRSIYLDQDASQGGKDPTAR